MILISDLVLNVDERGSAVASTEVYGADKKTYINTGSGNVFRLSWNTPTLTDDTIDRYSLIIKRHDTTINVYYDIFDKNIGLVNEFYVGSSMLPALPAQYMLSIYVIAYGKQGSVLTSNVINPYISKGSGSYVKVADGYMKRAVAFVNAPIQTSAEEEVVLLDSQGRTLLAQGEEGEKPLTATATKVLTSVSGWTVVQEGYTKDSAGVWRTNDIKYEVLVDNNGAIITDSNNEPIYVL